MRARGTVGPVALLLGVAAAGLGCASGPEISNTGYSGTWVRGNDRVQSTVAIQDRDGEYRFRWTLDSADGSWKVRCNWDGSCEEFVDGEKTSDYEFKTWIDSRSGLLMVECRGRYLRPGRPDLHYVDELVVGADGLTLDVYTLFRDGVMIEGKDRPHRAFEKVADAVAGVAEIQGE